jgi:integrase
MAKEKSKAKRRDRVWERPNKDGTMTYLAVVRIKPFDPSYGKFSTRAEARQWADTEARALKDKRRTGAVNQKITSETLGGLIDAYRADIEVQKLKSFENLTLLLGFWANRHGAEKIREFNIKTRVREARDALHKRGVGPATTNRYTSALAAVFKWAQKNTDLIDDNKTWPSGLRMKEPRGRTRYLNDQELAAIKEAAEKHSPTMYAAIIVSIACGLRQSEMLRLVWSDIDFSKATLTIHISKTGKPRVVHLVPPAVDALKKLRREGVPNIGRKHVFLNKKGGPLDKSTLNFCWEKIRAAAKLEDFRWHDLRHSCASFHAQLGASLYEIGSVLGHASPVTTARYSHLVQGRPITGSDALAKKLSS